MKRAHEGKSRANDGFSLVELLVVVAIIGILLGMYMSVFAKVLAKARKVESMAAIEQTQIARLADNANIARPSAPAGVDRAACRAAYHQTLETSSGPILATEMRYRVTNEAEFRAYWYTLINPAATWPLEFDGSTLFARDDRGNTFSLEPLAQDGWSPMQYTGTGPFPVLWEFLSTNMGEMSINEMGINVLYSDGHIGYVRYKEAYPASPLVADLSHRFVAVQ